MTTEMNKYRRTLVDRDGVVLVAFTLFSLLLLLGAIYVGSGKLATISATTTQADLSRDPYPAP